MGREMNIHVGNSLSLQCTKLFVTFFHSVLSGPQVIEQSLPSFCTALLFQREKEHLKRCSAQIMTLWERMLWALLGKGRRGNGGWDYAVHNPPKTAKSLKFKGLNNFLFFLVSWNVRGTFKKMC